jgi:hypothetical protein
LRIADTQPQGSFIDRIHGYAHALTNAKAHWKR